MPDTRVAFSWTLYGLLQCISVLGCALRSAWYRPLLFLPISLIGFHLVFRSATGTLLFESGLGGIILIQLAFAYDYLVLTDIQMQLHRVGERPGQIISASFKDRLVWSWQLSNNPRGIGWGHELAHIPKNPSSLNSPQNKGAFLRSRMFTICLCMVVQTTIYIVNAVNPALVPGAPPLLTQSFYIRMLSTFGLGLPPIVQMTELHCIASIVAVGTGLSQAADWPPLFGSLTNMYTIQSFWKNTWHQGLRRPIVTISNFIIHDVLHIRRSKKHHFGLYLLKIHMRFLISASIHAGGEFMLNGHGGHSTFIFFMLQAPAVAFESMVRYIITGSTQQLPGSRPPRLMWRLLGFVYVLLWFILTGPFLQQPLVDAGLFVINLGPRVSGVVARCLGIEAT